MRFHGIFNYLTAAVYSNDGTGSKKGGLLLDALLNALSEPTPASVLLVDDRLANLERASARGWFGDWMPLDPEDNAESSFPRFASLKDIFVHLATS